MQGKNRELASFAVVCTYNAIVRWYWWASGDHFSGGIMLVIKIELWPGGDESSAREINRGYIWNDGTGTIDVGNYKAEFLKRNQKTKNKGVWKKSILKGFKRQELLAWDLLAQMLVLALGSERITKHWKKK